MPSRSAAARRASARSRASEGSPGRSNAAMPSSTARHQNARSPSESIVCAPTTLSARSPSCAANGSKFEGRLSRNARRASATIPRARALIDVSASRSLTVAGTSPANVPDASGPSPWREFRADVDDDAAASRSAVSTRPSSRCSRRLRSDGQSEKSLRQRDERAGEVAAVHGRHVARVQRRERRRVVPVQEVPFVALETLEGRQRPIEALDRRRRREVAEVVSGQRRQQAHADVGRRRAARQPWLGPSSW